MIAEVCGVNILSEAKDLCIDLCHTNSRHATLDFPCGCLTIDF
jgi:hypothetical protein